MTSAKVCKPIHEIKNYLIIISPFESGKCGKEEKKLQKIVKSFLDGIKGIFHSF